MKRLNIFFSKLRSQFFGAAIFLLGVLLVQSCKKPENELGLNLQPQDELLDMNVVDTVSLRMYTIREDSLRTDELSVNVLGSYEDPEFGYTEAATYFQVTLGDLTSVSFIDPDSITIDSVFLSLEYQSYYGNLDQQTFGLYWVTDSLHKDSVYYTNSTLGFDSSQNWIEPGHETFVPDPLSNLIVGSDTLDPQMRIKLRNSFGDTILNRIGGYADNDDLWSFLRGFLIRPENGPQAFEEGALLYLDLEDAASKIVIYHTDTVGGQPVQEEFELMIDEKSGRFTRARHDYAGTSVGMAIMDSSLGKSATHIQSLAGVKTVVEFPHILNLIDTALGEEPMVGINKAELVLPVEYYFGSSFFPNDFLSVRMLNDSLDEDLIPDITISTIYGSSGTYDSDNNEYRFVITQYIQRLLTGNATDPQNHLRIVTNLSSVTGNRCILAGPESINRRQPKLLLTFSKY